MKYVNIRDMNASRIIVGCMRIADKPLEQTEKLIIEGMKAGVNTFDVADIYGGNGNCEKMLGVALKDLSFKRDEYLLQTKCGIRKTEMGKWFDFSKEHIITSAENSLRNLKTEYLDLFLLHRPDTLIEADEVASAFEKLQSQGKVRTFGVSNFSAMQIQYLKAHGIDVAVNQMQFSLGHTAMIDAGMNVNMYNNEAVSRAGDVLEYCRLRDIRLQAWSPLQYGFFEGTFIGDEKFADLNEVLNQLAEKYNVTSTAIAFAWILRHPAKMQVVTGTTTPQRLAEICKSTQVNLTNEEWYRLYLSTGKVLP